MSAEKRSTRVLVIGKCPPIQGGVSAQTHWTATQLAQRGHSVQLMTNADEVEQGYRQIFLTDEQQATDSLIPNGLFDRKSSSRSSSQRFSHIPFCKSYSHKLFGLASSSIEACRPDVILGWYFEPYAMVATILGKLYDIPVIVKHAGSDIGRLASQPQLRMAYQWMLRNASIVMIVNQERVRSLLTEMGLDENKARLSFANKLPTYFQDSSNLDLSAWLGVGQCWLEGLSISPVLLKRVLNLNNKKLHDGFIIGTYGKIGELKGSYDLLRALEQLAEGGKDFNFLIVGAGNTSNLARYYETILCNTALAERTWILPLLPPWSIPSFINLCDVVCFLEREFPIPFHNPMVPREVLSRGRCLILSEEISKLQFFSNKFENGQNVLLVNPKDHEQLSAKLETLLGSKDAINDLACRGKMLSESLERNLPDITAEVQTVEELLG